MPVKPGNKKNTNYWDLHNPSVIISYDLREDNWLLGFEFTRREKEKGSEVNLFCFFLFN